VYFQYRENNEFREDTENGVRLTNKDVEVLGINGLYAE